MKRLLCIYLLVLACPTLLVAQTPNGTLRMDVVEFPEPGEARLLLVSAEGAELTLLVAPRGTNECIVWVDLSAPPKYVNSPGKNAAGEPEDDWHWVPLARDAYLTVDKGSIGAVDLQGKKRVYLAPNDPTTRCHFEVVR